MRFPATVLCVAIAAIATCGCTPSVMLKNPQTGETTICKGGDSYGLIGLPGRNIQERCLDDFEKQGYRRVPTSK